MIPPKSLSSWPSRHARRCLLKPAVLAGFALIGFSSFYPPLAIPALASEAETSAARSAIANHPNVIRLRSFVCQSFAQADIARANSYPQVNLRVNGGSPLLDRIDRFETNRRRFDDTPVDAVVGIRQNLFDWGVTDNSIKIAETNRQIARLDVVIETDRQAADLLSILNRYRELEQHRLLYENLQRELEEITARIEEGVNAGALTLNDLREIKINNLDIEVAHLQVVRELDILKGDLADRYKITVEQGLPFLIKYEQLSPSDLPHKDSAAVREIRKLDLQKMVSEFEIARLNAQRKPAVSGILDTHIYDVDGNNGEYEVVGRVELSVPLYDGGSNKAGRREAEWQGRSVLSERSGVIRNYDSQSKQIRQTIELLDRNITSTAEKIITVESQLESHLAREGQTVSAPLAKAGLLMQQNSLLVQHISQQSERDREFIRGLFFADALGSILNFEEEVTQC